MDKPGRKDRYRKEEIGELVLIWDRYDHSPIPREWPDIPEICNAFHKEFKADFKDTDIFPMNNGNSIAVRLKRK